VEHSQTSTRHSIEDQTRRSQSNASNRRLLSKQVPQPPYHLPFTPPSSTHTQISCRGGRERFMRAIARGRFKPMPCKKVSSWLLSFQSLSPSPSISRHSDVYATIVSQILFAFRSKWGCLSSHRLLKAFEMMSRRSAHACPISASLCHV
jgi:hypothetical protein